MKKNVVFGFLGTQLDNGQSEKRWGRWRPTVALCAHPEKQPVDRVELLLSSPTQRELAELVTADIAMVSPGTEVCLRDLPIENPWDFAQVYAALHDFAKAYPFSESEAYYFHLTTGTHIMQICSFLLTEARYFPAKLLETLMQKNQAEPWRGAVEVIDLDLSAYDQLAGRFKLEQSNAENLLKGGIETRNPAFNTIVQRIEQVSLRSKAPILFMGETGVGKSAMAARVYELRKQRHLVEGPLVAVNCATLRGDNAMSALFGHKKGAFTGAASDRPGLLKTADGGVLFLDEIGELGLDEQAMLLRCLEDGTFIPLGADKPASSNFQLLAGTNRDLRDAVRGGVFRADLLARINLWTFSLPGLRQRPEDIEPNLTHELSKASREIGLQVSMNKDAREAYLSFAQQAPWPGNFRDFSASILRMATLAAGGRITLNDVLAELEQLNWAWELKKPTSEGQGQLVAQAQASGFLGADLDPFDKAGLECALQALKDSEGSLAEAGRKLFSVSRKAKASSNDSDRLRKYLTRMGVVDISGLLAWL